MKFRPEVPEEEVSDLSVEQRTTQQQRRERVVQVLQIDMFKIKSCFVSMYMTLQRPIAIARSPARI